MPTYEYVCRECGEHLEVVQSFTDDPLDTCERCGGSLRKVFSAAGIIFKGSGYYVTDSRSERVPAAGSSGASEGSSKKAASNGASDGAASDSSSDSSSKSAASDGASSGSSESSGSSGSSGSSSSTNSDAKSA